MRIELKEWVLPTAVGIGSLGAGVGLGFLLAHRKYNKIFEKQARIIEEYETEVPVQMEFQFEEGAEKLNSMLQQVMRVVKEFKERGDEFLNEHTNTIFDEAKAGHPSNGPRDVILTTVPNDEEDEQMVNVFVTEEEDDDWDYEVEVAQRSESRPYVIHRDEYFSNEMDLSQQSLQYYAGDNILCDEYDKPIYNPDKIVGDIKFGHGSRDPNICYIRNEELGVEFEVLNDPGYYQTEVLGQEVDKGLKHSKGIPKFRLD